VPIHIRAGKCLPVTATEVFVRLRRPPTLFAAIEPNYYRFRISPDVVIALGAMVKSPGEEMVGKQTELVAIEQATAEEMEAYERLLGDAMRGDRTAFAREDYVEQAWRIVEPILRNVVPVHEYEPGTWGPPEADRLVGPGGWHNPGVGR
jgi:glucose-6-phosphate 1-dehydrogenase